MFGIFTIEKTLSFSAGFTHIQNMTCSCQGNEITPSYFLQRLQFLFWSASICTISTSGNTCYPRLWQLFAGVLKLLSQSFVTTLLISTFYATCSLVLFLRSASSSTKLASWAWQRQAFRRLVDVTRWPFSKILVCKKSSSSWHLFNVSIIVKGCHSPQPP